MIFLQSQGPVMLAADADLAGPLLARAALISADFSAYTSGLPANFDLQSLQQNPITRPLYGDVMSDFDGMSVLTGHFELTGFPACAAAVATSRSARNDDEMTRLMRSPPTILTLRPPRPRGCDYFFSPPWGGVPDLLHTLITVLLAQSGLCFTSYWESAVSPQESQR